jgi:hypothetical protein
MIYPCHPGDQAEIFSKYLSYDSTQITLQNDSCMCMACHKDAAKYCAQQPPVEPRWHKIMKKNNDECPSAIHCPLCHQEWTDKSEQSPCKSNSRTVPSSTWKKGQSVQFWNNVLSSPPRQYVPTLRESSHLCQRHYLQVYDMYKSKKCFHCNAKSDNWTLFSMISKERKEYFAKMYQNTLAQLESQWLCISCISDKQSSPLQASTYRVFYCTANYNIGRRQSKQEHYRKFKEKVHSRNTHSKKL